MTRFINTIDTSGSPIVRDDVTLAVLPGEENHERRTNPRTELLDRTGFSSRSSNIR